MKKALALLALMASCSTPSVTVVPAAIESSLTGSVGVATGGLGDFDANDLDSMGLGDSEAVFFPKINLNFLRSEISVGSFSGGFAGDGELEFVFPHDGASLVGDVHSELDVKVTNLLWTYNFVNADTAHFGVGLGVTDFDFALNLHELGNPGTSLPPLEKSVPVPLVGLRAGGDFGLLRLEGSFATLQVDADGGEISVTDLDVYAGFDVIGDSGSVVLGYRSFDVDASYDDGEDSVELELGLGGPYAGVRLGF
jgi:hypothetical protein